MSNPAKSKGTSFENEVVELLRPIWPQADRAKAGNPSCDVIGVPIPVEAKHRKAWDLKGWVRKIRAVAPTHRWAIFAADGDRRKAESVGTLMVIDAQFGAELLAHWQRHHDTDQTLLRVDL